MYLTPYYVCAHRHTAKRHIPKQNIYSNIGEGWLLLESHYFKVFFPGVYHPLMFPLRLSDSRGDKAEQIFTFTWLQQPVGFRRILLGRDPFRVYLVHPGRRKCPHRFT